MVFGLCCGCEEQRYVTVRRYDLATGATAWEYGPGTKWTWHYGSDIVSGLVVPKDTVLNKYIRTVGSTWTRSSLSTTPANAAEAVHLIQIDATTGDVVNDSVLSGEFATGATKRFYTPSLNPTIYGLSSGDIVAVENKRPVLELIDWKTNVASKQYVLHPHGQKIGNITLTTYANTTCSFAVTAGNATIEAAIAALAVVSAVSVTGGPWPFAAVDIDITWTTSGGDFKAFATDTFSGGISTSVSAVCYSASTGEIVSSVGAEFGLGSSITAEKILSNGTASIPYPGGAETSLGVPFASAGSDMILVRTNDTPTLEGWTVGSTWTREWVIWLNTPRSADPGRSDGVLISNVESNSICVMWYGQYNADGFTGYTGTDRWSGAFVDTTDGSIAYLSEPTTDTFIGGIGTSRPFLADGGGTDLLVRYDDYNWDDITSDYEEDSSDTAAIETFGLNTMILYTATNGPNTPDSSPYYTRLPSDVINATEDAILTGQMDLQSASPPNTLITRGLEDSLHNTSPQDYWRYYWNYQVKSSHRALSGEFRMKLIWNTTGSTDLVRYTAWLDYTEATATLMPALQDELIAAVQPPGSTYTDGIDIPLVQIQTYAGHPDAGHVVNMLEHGVQVIYTVDNNTGDDRYIHASKKAVFLNANRIEFEFRNMVWEPVMGSDTILWERSSASPPVWGRTWTARSGVPANPKGAWLRNEIVIAFGPESRAEL